MSVQYPVPTVQAAFSACDPDIPLSSSTDSRYVDLTDVRGGDNFVELLATAIIQSTRHSYQLVTGHRGCGKSTELLRLKQHLEDCKYVVVYLDIGEILDLGDINYLDVLLSIAQAVETEVRHRGLSLHHDLLEDLQHWFTDKKIITEEHETKLEGELATEAKAKVSIPLFATLIASLTSKIKSGSSQREEIRRIIEREINVFIDKLNKLILSARIVLQQQEFKDVVIIVDQLEKMAYKPFTQNHSSYSDFFVVHAEQLKSVDCHIVYTVPISLLSNENISDDFDSFVIPMVNYQKAAGQAKLQELASRRVRIDSVFESLELVNQLAQVSGDVVRDLMRLVRFACQGTQDKIRSRNVDKAIIRLTTEYERLIKDEHLPTLKIVAIEKRSSASMGYAELLRLRLVLQYQNGKVWADVHPVLNRIEWVAKTWQMTQ